MRINWEYKIISLGSDMGTAQTQLDKLGHEGWELVTIIHHADAVKFMNGHPASPYFAFFKSKVEVKS